MSEHFTDRQVKKILWTNSPINTKLPLGVSQNLNLAAEIMNIVNDRIQYEITFRNVLNLRQKIQRTRCVFLAPRIHLSDPKRENTKQELF